MKKIIFTIVLFSIFNSSFAQTWKWSKKVGGTLADHGYGISIDTAANIYITGDFADTLFIGVDTIVSAGNSDIFIAKYDPTGFVQWAKSAGGTGADRALGIITDDLGNAYITGNFRDTTIFGTDTLISNGVNVNDIFIAKYNSAGNLLWAKMAGGTGNDVSWGIDQDDLGYVYITGHFTGVCTFSSTDTLTSSDLKDIFLAKYDSFGNLVWVKQAGSTGNDRGTGVAIDPFGNIYLSGIFQSTAIFGITDTLVSAGNWDTFIAKYDSSGTFLWAKSAGGSLADRANAISTDGFGNAYLTGFFTDTAIFGNGSDTLISAGADDIFIAKYDAAGNLLWVKSNGSSSSLESGQSIVSDDSLSIYLTGYFSGTAIFGSDTLVSTVSRDIFVVKYDLAGNILWAKHVSGTGVDDRGNGISIDKYGNSYIAGYFGGTQLFGNDTLIASNFDIFVAKLGCDYPPVVNFGYTIDTTFTVSFTDSSVNAGTYYWDFGDGNTDSVANPQHTYPVADSTYTVCLIGTNPCDVDTICQTVQLGCPAPVAKFSYMDSVFTVNFADSSQNAVSYYWEFGDGNTDTSAGTQHTYAFADSVYVACLTVTNACGKDSTICDSITIICPAPVAKFSYVDSGLTVNFADSSMNAVSWFWNFGDGTDTTVASPPHTYPPADSSYYVCLTATNVCGKDSVFCDSVTISCPVPVAKFGYNVTFSTVSFFDSSSNAVSWFWNFGDGNTDNIASPLNIYSLVDSAYYVCLTVTSVCGKDSTICDSVTVILTGIDQSLFSKYQLKVYPNPNAGAFVIELNLPNVQNVEVALFNASGKLIYNENIKQLSGTFRKEIKLKDHSRGIYYLQVIIPNIKAINKKIIIE
ncbi:MAG: T9SS type A sorting domain-containing protein [Cytophagales bacterium]|nr:T9SS type A sorting domain-containing protein [Cytophagales bacterium]